MFARIRRGLTFANVCSFLALTIALGTGTAYAANTVFSEDIVNGEVKTADIAASAVKTAKIDFSAVTSVKVQNETLSARDLASNSVATSELAPSAVQSEDVLDDSLTLGDLLGADTNGSVNLGGVPNGRCDNVTLGVSGAQVGQVPVIATKEAMQGGILLYAQRVSAAGQVEVLICNFSGTTMTSIENLPVRVITFG